MALINSYEDSLSYLSSFSKQGAPVKDLSRFSALAAALGDPQNGLKCIHIVGTNGKGTVAELIARSLTECGYKTGRFTSPFIIDVRERITLDGKFIPKVDFARIIQKVADAAESCRDKRFSQFEILTAVCFLWFLEQGAEYCVIEAGIGGTLDCTNIIPPPEAAVVTSIGLDHTAILGATEAEIARSKSGVIKGGIAVAAAGISESAMAVLRGRCESVGARLVVPDTSMVRVGESDLSGSSFSYRGRDFRISLCGKHQIGNALTALETLDNISYGNIFGENNLSDSKITFENVRRGIEKAAMPARLEQFLPHGGLPYIILDGGHNPQAMTAAREVLCHDAREKTALIGMIDTKDYETALGIILPCFGRIVFTDGFAPNAVAAEELCAVGRRLGAECSASHGIADGLALAAGLTGEGGVLFIGGSLYMAAEARKALLGECTE